MVPISYENILERLHEAIPEFPADYNKSDEHVSYCVIPGLMRFTISLAENIENEQLLRRVFDFLEDAAKSHDAETDALLRDSLHLLAVSKHSSKFKGLMGRNTRFLFAEVKDDLFPAPWKSAKWALWRGLLRACRSLASLAGWKTK